VLTQILVMVISLIQLSGNLSIFLWHIVGIFQNAAEIAASPKQVVSANPTPANSTSPGDLKIQGYKRT